MGTLLVAVSAVAFGFMALFSSWARAPAPGDDAGASTPTLLFLRFVMASACMLLLLVVRQVRGRGPGLVRAMGGVRGVLVGVIMGAGLYFGEALAFFTALERIPSGVASLLLYLYPGLVALLAWVLLRDRPTARTLGALTLALIGAALTIGPALGPALAGGGAGLDPVGVGLGVLTALIYAVYILVGAHTARGSDGLALAGVVIASASCSFGALVLAQGWQPPTTALGWLGTAGLAVVSTALPIAALLAGMARIGPVRASTLSTLEPATTLAVGVLLMGEPVSAVGLVGAVLILGAAVIIARARPAPKPERPEERPGSVAG